MLRFSSFLHSRRFRLLLTGCSAISALVIGANVWVLVQSRDRIVKDANRLQPVAVGLVLGTSPLLHGRGPNPFFEGRMDTAALLYRTGKVRHLLLSGDNHTREYDEPAAMRDALVARGVPFSAMTVDDAGFRTLDSMARAKAIFGLGQVTIVTDGFHQPRALFLAQACGLDAYGFPSEHVAFWVAKKTLAREIVSRFVACLDVYLLKTKPRFLGKSERILAAQP